MTTPQVDISGEISINNIRYPVVGPVRRFLASRPTPRMTIGPAQATTHQDLSYLAFDDWRGGIGIERMDPDRDLDRMWFSTATLRQKRHLTLPALATKTAASGVTGSFTIGAIIDRSNTIFAAFGQAIREYTPSSDSWGSTLQTLGAGATDAINYQLDGEKIAFAYTTGYDYFDGTTWRVSTKDVVAFAFWDDRLWGIDNSGQLWWSSTAGTEVDDAKLQLPAGSISSLFVGRAPDGRPRLFAATKRGLYIHNSDDNRFELTDLRLPFHPDNGLGGDAWRDATYVSAGLEVFKYINGENSAVISLVGLSQDHGLPSSYRGRIRRLIPTLNGLVALVDATSNTAVSDVFQSEAITAEEVISEDSGQSALAEWDGRGWQMLWTSDENTLPVTVAVVSNAYDDYQMWWAQDQRIFRMTIPRDILNPSQISDRNYGPSASHELAWFDADETNVDKVALIVAVHMISATTSETLAVRYRLNDDDTVANQTTLGTVITSGATEFVLPSSTNRTGFEWRTIKFVLDLARGSTVTLTPDMDRIEFYFLRKETSRWGASVEINIPKDGYDGFSAETMYENMITAVEATLQVPVTWRDRAVDDAGSVNPYVYFMDVVQENGNEMTGNDFSGRHTLVMLERAGEA